MCHRIGRGPTGTSGLGTRSEKSRIRIPCPPQKITTFIGSPHLGSRYGDDELTPPVANARELCRDLVLQIPREDQHVVGTSFPQRLDRQYRNVDTGAEPALLVRVAVDHEVDEVGSDTAVIEHGHALAGG